MHHSNTSLTCLILLTALCHGCGKETADIFGAAATGNLSELRAYIDADPKVIDSLNERGDSPLHMAIKHGQLESVDTLFKLGANPDVQTRREGDTPMHYAIMRGDARIASALLKYKPDLSIANHHGEGPLDWAKSHQGDESEKIEKLIEEALNGG